MCVQHRNLMWKLLLLPLCGCLHDLWNVNYHQQLICAAKGSTAVILCSFYYPSEFKVTGVMWGHNKHFYEGPFIFDSRQQMNPSSKFWYDGDQQQNCTLKIHKVEQSDEGQYAFRFITNTPQGKFTGFPGSTLKVLDLKIMLTNENGTIKEGDSVNLTCVNGCDSGHDSFTWSKDRKAMNEGPVLYLNNVSATDSGNYTCSLSKYNGATSGVININVEYGPKNTLASVRPSMVGDGSSNIILICSSLANPPVESYLWFRINEQNDVMAVGQQQVLVSREGGQYLCTARNKHGSQNSSTVTIHIEAHQTFNSDVLIISTVTALLIMTTVIAIKRFKKNGAQRALGTDCEEDMQDTLYANWSAFKHNQSHKGNQSVGATAELTYATVDFYVSKTSDIKQQMDSDHGEESVIYSTVRK